MSKQTKAFISLWFGMIFVASASSVIAKIGQLGANHPVNGRNPISFCNVLLAGNVVASVVLYLVYYKQLNKQNLKKLSLTAWFCMTMVAILGSVLAPAFYFFALLLTPVINVVLIATLNIPLTLVYGIIFFKDRPTFLIYIGAFLALAGVTTTYIMTTREASASKEIVFLQLGHGPLAHFFASIPEPGKFCALLATLFTVMNSAISRKSLQTVPIGIYLVFRMCLGAVIFAVFALVMFGPDHFSDLFSTYLWKWMLAYGGLVVGLGTLLWNKGIQYTTSAEVSTVASFIPVAGVFFAYLIVNEIPSLGQIVGGSIIIVGVFTALIGKLREKRILEVEDRFKKPPGFTGV